MSEEILAQPITEALTPAQLFSLQRDQVVMPAQFTLLAELYTLGRAPSCMIIVRHPLVSRLHARIERQGLRYVLLDAGSANGTFVNGARLQACYALKNDDLIGLGAASPLFRFVDPDTTTPAADLLQYDERQMGFFIAGARVELAPMQLRLLRHLYAHAGETCSRESCATAIWGHDYDPGLDAGALDQALNSLRKTLRLHAPAISFIKTWRGLGYSLTLE